MALLVQKFGGTSLASLKHINNIADIIAKAKQAGNEVVVIVSAMSGETDKLIRLAHSVSASPDEREYAALVSTGEQVSMSLLAMALINRGIDACSYTGQQANIRTCNGFKKAKIESIDTRLIESDLSQGKVVVIAGFQGVDRYNNTTTLGRGGSDTTAVAIAASLKADECQIYTDVDGIYTTDPNLIKNARKLDKISFKEMIELASQGAKVLQIRAVEFAGKYNVPLRVLSSSEKGDGTLITYGVTAMEGQVVTGIAYSMSEAKVSLIGIPDKTSLISEVLAEVSSHGITIDVISQCQREDEKTDLTFTVHQDEYKQCIKVLRKLAISHAIESVLGDTDVAKVSIIGTGLQTHPDIAAVVFRTLTSNKVAVQLISCSEMKMSLVIDEAFLEVAVKALHAAFKLESGVENQTQSLNQRKLELACGNKTSA